MFGGLILDLIALWSTMWSLYRVPEILGNFFVIYYVFTFYKCSLR